MLVLSRAENERLEGLLGDAHSVVSQHELSLSLKSRLAAQGERVDQIVQERLVEERLAQEKLAHARLDRRRRLLRRVRASTDADEALLQAQRLM